METDSGLELPRAREAARLFVRAVRLSCPNCGGRPVLEHWLRLQVRCPRCGMRLERGEHDYFTGSMLFNLIISELLFALLFVGYLIVVWPDVNWDVAQYVIVTLVAAAPLVLYPVSKLVWLAFDLMLRPLTPSELEWHRTSQNRFSTGHTSARDG